MSTDTAVPMHPHVIEVTIIIEMHPRTTLTTELMYGPFSTKDAAEAWRDSFTAAHKLIEAAARDRENMFTIAEAVTTNPLFFRVIVSSANIIHLERRKLMAWSHIAPGNPVEAAKKAGKEARMYLAQIIANSLAGDENLPA